jgi:gluconate 5-dehydrogenase
MPASIFDLTDRVVLIQAGGMGPAHQAIPAMAEHGASIVIADIDLERAQAAAALAEAHGAQAMSLKTDVLDPEDVDRMIAATMERFGKIDVLINHAGGRHNPPPGLTPLEIWHRQTQLSITSCYLCTTRVVEVMKPRNYGKIINMSSVYGLVGRNPGLYPENPTEPNSSLGYAAGKGAIVQLTREMAVMYGPYNITVNAIAPGMVNSKPQFEAPPEPASADLLSEATPLGRRGPIDACGGAFIFFASAASDFVTGHTMPVDGGWVIW